MILTTNETQWVSERMKVYNIKYQEIYNEVFDHILTAIEDKRFAGDNRPILNVFQDVVDTHFGGYKGIDELAAGQEKVYRKQIQKAFKAILSGYLTWKMLAYTLAVIVISWFLPETRLMQHILLSLTWLFAISPAIYALVYVSRKVKVSRGKYSLLKVNLVTQAASLVILLNGIIHIPTLFAMDDTDRAFKIYRQLPLPVLTIVMIAFMLLNLSAITLCNKEMEKKTAW